MAVVSRSWLARPQRVGPVGVCAVNAAQAIDAQGHLMRDMLRKFGSVSLALAAYNAGPGTVERCGCVPSIPETQAYVAKILGLMGGAGQAIGNALGGMEVRLVG